MSHHERKELAAWAVKQALKQGAQQASVQISDRRGLEMDYRDSRLEKLQESIRSTLSLSIYRNHRFSSHNTNDLSRKGLGKFVADAVAMTRFLGEDPFRSLPDPKYYAGRERHDLKQVDPALLALTTPRKIELVRALEASAKSQSDKIISATSSYSDGHARLVQVHSNGFEGESESTECFAGAEVSVKDASSRPVDDDYAYVRHFRQLPAPEALGQAAARRALNKLGQHKLGSARLEMIVENRAANRLVGDLMRPLSGQALQQKASFLDGQLGKPVAAPLLTLVDDPFLPEGLGSGLFDGEGLTTRRRVLIEKGVLRDYYISYYYSRKLKVEPTTGGPTNLVLEPGKRSQADILKDVKRGILVTGFIGGNSNSTTGDFSMGILGQYIENGAVQHAVNEMNISGNYKNLWQQLIELGNDPYLYSSRRPPTLRFQDVQFSGK